MDEPTNHLDAVTVGLQRFCDSGSCDHHPRSLFLRGVPGSELIASHQGNYSGWLSKQNEQEGRAEDARKITLAWLEQKPAPKARPGRSGRTAYEKLPQQDQEQRQDIAKIVTPAGPRLGDKVAYSHTSARHLAKSC